MQHFPSPRAAEAIISQITSGGDCEGKFCADVDGRECEFVAWFRVDWANAGGHYFNRDVYADCTLTGAWTYDADDAVSFAGNRAETVALIGEAAVCRWEREQAYREMEE